MYSCALFETEVAPSSAADANPSIRFVSTLEQAQQRKIDALLQRLEPIEPHHTLLDIGFGWGGISIRAAEKYGCKVVGITLSTEQKALAEERVRAKGLQEKISFELIDYRDFAKLSKNQKCFERIISCEMIADFSDYGNAIFKLDFIDFTMGDKCFLCFIKFDLDDFIETMIWLYENEMSE